MAIGRIRRSARRGLAVAILGWLGVAVFAVLMAPSASAAPTATVEIKNVTPPAAGVDKGGRVTFVNRIPAQNKGGITIPLAGSLTATVHTDVAVSFFGQTRALQNGQSTEWTFNDSATPGTITYTYRIVPQAGLSATVANQVVTTVTGQLPRLPAPVPYVVQTIAPDLPAVPGVNLPQLPTVTLPLPLPPGTQPPTDVPGAPSADAPPTTPPTSPPASAGASGPAYTYDTGSGAPRLAASDIVAAAAFDPARYFVPGQSLGGVDRAGSGSGSGSGSGGVAGSYDGASVPVFGELAGLSGAAVEDADIDEAAAADASAAQTLPASAVAAIVALAAVTAALVRTHQASRASR
jgi:hypothetical protein